MEFIALLLALVTTAIAAENCSISPIFVDLHDRCVDNCFTFQYGLFMGIGNPFQNESLWPSLSHNETTIAGVDYCGDNTSSTCVNQTHGFFSPELSATFRTLEDYTPLDSSFTVTEDISTVEQVGGDTLNIFTHYFDPSPPSLTRVPDFPVTVLANYSGPSSPWFGPAGLLGLGSTSTLLTALKDMSLISSRSFGLYMGAAYPRAAGAVNGSLTLGGYDSGRMTKEAVHYTLSPPTIGSSDPSPYKVQVVSVSLTDFANDNATTVISSGAFDAFLTTSQYEMTLPSDVTQQFIDSTSATAASPDVASISGKITSLSIPASFAGALTISLSGGLNITLDTASGDLRNISNLTPVSTPPSDNTKSPVPLLGTALLSHLYLTTNYDSTPPSFYLSQALPHGPYVITKPLCPNETPIAYTSPRISSFQRNGIIGAILGGVIGGIGLIFAVFWGWRKYAQKKASQAWEEKYGDDESGGYEVDEYGNKVPISATAGNTLGATGASASGAGKRAKLKGILKPSRHSQKRRRLDKGKNPITAYYLERNIHPATPKKSWSSSESDDEGGYDMSQLQGAIPPHALGYEDGNSASQINLTDHTNGRGTGAGAFVQPYPSRSPPRQQHSSQQQPSLIMNVSRSESRSRSPPRSRSPSPIFPPDEHIPTSFLEQSSSSYPSPRLHSQPLAEPPSVSFPRRPVPGTQNFAYSNFSLPTNTARCSVSHSNKTPTADSASASASASAPASQAGTTCLPTGAGGSYTHGPRPLTLNPTPNSSVKHNRSHSEERRRAMNLTVNTYFDGPPTKHDRVGKKFKPGKTRR